ncbi:photosystem II reaction center PsbP [Geitlerinema sp. PCC 9228]|jgi:photosystem II oxygen-evolving enhancer protein 2|uniref:photosystem II reaction center PsbP n=1 Tax=Geitlerinema sp. PCC 9228 TaxID=111611 RepID=UPI0008F9CC6F|nr:photosystem II reaction center PsbP [Geitlerinema sp. PCC 9228]
MWRRLVAICLLLVSFSVTACSTSPTGELKSYVDSRSGYEFLYPNGWIPVEVSGNGPDLVMRDLIERSENLSVVIGDIPEGESLQDLGTPTEVGQNIAKTAISNATANRQAELVSVGSKETPEHTYYLLEYKVDFSDRESRHNLASVAVSRGKLFTFNISTPERRWKKMQDKFQAVVNSFSVY